MNWDTARKLEAEKWITIQKHPEVDLWILNYTARCQFAAYWTEETMQCRGLIVDGDFNIVARPFRKFFTLEQHLAVEGAPALQWDAPYVIQEKMDGSLGILYWTGAYGKSEPRIATRGSFVSDQARKATEMLHRLPAPAASVFQEGYTYLFEILYPENRIVVDYGTESVIMSRKLRNRRQAETHRSSIGRSSLLRLRRYIPRAGAWKLLLAVCASLSTSMSVARAQSHAGRLYEVPKSGLSQCPVRDGPATDQYLQCERLYGVGLQLPDYRLMDPQKKPFPLSRLKGKVIVIDLWTTNCSPCLRAIPPFGRLAHTYPANKVAFISVCIDGDKQPSGFRRWTTRFRSSGLHFYYDPAGSTKQGLRDRMKNYMGPPAEIIVDRSGRVVGSLQGYDDVGDPNLKQLKTSIDRAIKLPLPAKIERTARK